MTFDPQIEAKIELIKHTLRDLFEFDAKVGVVELALRELIDLTQSLAEPLPPVEPPPVEPPPVEPPPPVTGTIVFPGRKSFERPMRPNPVGSGQLVRVTPATLQEAIRTATPGDVIQVANGEATMPALWIYNQHNGAAPVTVWAEYERYARINVEGSGNSDGFHVHGTSSGWVFDGLTIQGTKHPQAPIRIRGQATDIAFRRCFLGSKSSVTPRGTIYAMDVGVKRLSFEGCEIEGTQHPQDGHALRLWRFSGALVDNCLLHRTRMNLIDGQNMADLTVTHNRFTDGHRGVYHFTDTSAPGNHKGSNHRMKFDENDFEFVGVDRGFNSVQLQNTVGQGISMSRNRSVRPIPGTSPTSRSEDHFNIGHSGGLPGYEMLVDDNRIRGGGPSGYGSAVMIDGGHSYIWVRRNMIDRPGNVGIGISGGHRNLLEDNAVYSPALQFGPVGGSNVAYYVWDNPGLPSPDGCSGHTLRRNRANFRKGNGTVFGYWNGQNCGPVEEIDNNWHDPSVTEAIFNEPILMP